MASYIGLIHKEANSDFGVSFPDFPGAVTAGRTLDEARAMAEEALAFHIEGLVEDGEKIPVPSSLETVMADPENRGGVATLVDVKTPAPKSVRINITLSEDVLERIDRRAQEQGLSRSAYLALAGDTQAPGMTGMEPASQNSARRDAATEAVQREAYEAGYVVAMQMIREFATRPPAAATDAPRRQTRVQAEPAPRQIRRGDNARHIAEAMMILPDHTGPAAAIKRALAEKGYVIAYTSIRHGLNQLADRHEVTASDDGKTWRYLGERA